MRNELIPMLSPVSTELFWSAADMALVSSTDKLFQSIREIVVMM